MDLLDLISRLRSSGHRFVVATIVKASGSTPREAGTRMVIREDGTSHGTVGGGALEHRVVRDAQKLFENRGTRLVRYDLTRELGMCCGGQVELFFEFVGPIERLLLFGAGHIAQPLATMSKLAQFDVTIIDERSDLLTEERFPEADHRVVGLLEDVIKELPFDEATFIVVCTHDHRLDQRIVEACLPKRFRFLGVIGSRAKAAKTVSRLRAAGFDEDAIHRLRSPVGLNIGAQTPSEIAIAILAELIAQRHNRNLPPAWEPYGTPDR